MELKKNHITLTSTEDMCDLSAPLKILNVDFFSYTRFYFDGTSISLLTNTDWYQFFLKQEVPGCINVFSLESGCNLWMDLFPENAVSDAREHFDIDNGIHFANKENDYIEAISYASKKNNHKATSCFISNIDLLESFNRYFKKQAAPLIKKASENRIIIPEIMRGYEEIKSGFKLSAEDKKNFLAAIGDDNIINKISMREYECLQHISHGKTAKEIAKLLNISPRTVETYINNMKLKFNCTTKSDLSKIYWDYKIST